MPPVIGRWQRRCAWIGRHRWALVALMLALVASLSGGAGRLRVDDDYRAFIDPADPDLAALERFEKVFSRTEQLLLVFAPADGDVFSASALAALRDLTARAWSLPWAVRVDSLTNFQSTRAVGDEVIIAPLAGTEAAPVAPATIRAAALAEPELRARLVATDGAVAGVSVRLRFDDPRTGLAEAATAQARALARAFEHEHPRSRIYVTGNVALDAAFPEQSRRDLRHLTPLMLAFIAAVIALLLRSLVATAITLAVVGMAAIGALGAAGWLGIPVTAATASAPTIIMTLAVADCVHLLDAYLGAARRGEPPAEALAGALERNFTAISLTSATTVIGFLSLNLSDSPPFRDLGNLTAVGVALAWLLAVVLVPALLSAWVPAGTEMTSRWSLGRAVSRVVDWVLARRRAVVLVFVLLAAIAAGALPRLSVNDRFVEYFDDGVAFRRDTEFAAAHLGGIYRIHYALAAGAADGIYEPAYLERVDGFARWLRAQPGVVHVTAITDLVRRLARSMHGDDPRWFRLPATRAEAAQYLLAYQMSVPYGLDLNDSVAIDGSATRLTITLANPDNAELEHLAARADGWLRAHAPAAMHASAVGTPLIFARMAKRNIGVMLRGSLVALALIALLLALALGDVGLGLLSLVPNLLPALLAFGVWSATVGELGLALSVVTAMTLGIVVDDTVHILDRYLAARRQQGLDVVAALTRAYAEVGGALVITSAVLVAGFAVLATSAYAINQGLGRLSALVIALALVADLTLLPALLASLYGGAQPTSVAVRSRRLR